MFNGCSTITSNLVYRNTKTWPFPLSAHEDECVSNEPEVPFSLAGNGYGSPSLSITSAGKGSCGTIEQRPGVHICSTGESRPDSGTPYVTTVGIAVLKWRYPLGSSYGFSALPEVNWVCGPSYRRVPCSVDYIGT